MILRIGSIGMVTPVGLTAAASLAAIRARITIFQELPVPNPLPQMIMGAFVPRIPYIAEERLLALLEPAIGEATAHLDAAARAGMPLILALAHPARPDFPRRLQRDLVLELQRRLGWSFDPRHSTIVALGRAGGIAALAVAARLLRAGTVERCLVAGVDSLINSDVLGRLHQHDRLKLEDNSNGLIPGEAAVALEMTHEASTGPGDLLLVGLGEADETAVVDEEQPHRADGLVAAVRTALAEAGFALHEIDYRLSDVNGEHYYFKETANCVLRLLRQRKDELPIWHPADVLGDVGAPAGLALVGMAQAAARKGYAPGPVALCQSSSDEGHRAACVLRAII
jgi:3-oxoacyl-[acyl-carrier-protein] synthase I